MAKLVLLMALAALSAPAQDWARQRIDKSPRHTEWLMVKHGDRAVQTFIGYPEVKEKAPVVLVIHEIFGMTDWVQEVANEFAAAGYIAVAPDLLSGMGPDGKGSSSFAQGDATKAVSGLNPDQVTADLQAAADYAQKLPSAGTKLYLAGFCWGGGQTFRFATNRPGLAAAFVFYGPPPAPEAMTRITAPLYGFYGEMDARINSTIPATEKAMKDAGKTYEPVTYAGAGHGFMRAGGCERGECQGANRDVGAAEEADCQLRVCLRTRHSVITQEPDLQRRYISSGEQKAVTKIAS